jgi:GH25 family lysozyme M1 (1,4-beta-N-acetylmuramidase)
MYHFCDKGVRMSLKGIDVSQFQGTVDWDAVKNAGYQFAMIRAGYGFGTLDQQFERNISECNRIGLPVGVYWFCYATSPETARQEADGCVSAIAPYKLEYPICYDIEQDTLNYAARMGVTVTASLATQFIESFCNRVEELGYFAMFYSNRNFFNQFFNTQLSDKYALWYAYYNSQIDATDCGMWQYTDQGSVPGVSGPVDLDISFVDYATVIRNAGLNHLDGSKPNPSPVVIQNYVTYVIQKGDTLSSIAERFETTYQLIASLNNISNPDLIYVGETIKVPENCDDEGCYYTVRKGDTLSELALRFDTTVSELQSLNNISNANLIYVGEKIRIS